MTPRCCQVNGPQCPVPYGAARGASPSGTRHGSTWPAGHPENHHCATASRTVDRHTGGQCPRRAQRVDRTARATLPAGRQSASGRSPPDRSAALAGDRQAVAGYDLVDSPVKSISTLWAVGGHEVREQIQAAHCDAWRETLDWLEREVAFTRTGAGGVAQIETRGLGPLDLLSTPCWVSWSRRGAESTATSLATGMPRSVTTITSPARARSIQRESSARNALMATSTFVCGLFTLLCDLKWPGTLIIRWSVTQVQRGRRRHCAALAAVRPSALRLLG